MEENSQEKRKRVIFRMGLALLAAGILIAFYILSQLLDLFLNSDENAFVLFIVSSFTETGLLTFNDKILDLSIGSAKVLAIILFLLIARVAVGISTLLINSGVHLLSPEYHKVINDLKHRVSSLVHEFKSK